jgi:hypothetical protein
MSSRARIRVARVPKVVDEVLADLARHPGWAILEQRMKEHQEQEMRDFARALLFLNEPVDQIKVARQRGFFAGQRWLLRQARHELTAYQKESEESQAG